MKKLALLLCCLWPSLALAGVKATDFNPKFRDSVRVGAPDVWFWIKSGDSTVLIQGTMYIGVTDSMKLGAGFITGVDSIMGSRRLCTIYGWIGDNSAKFQFDTTTNRWSIYDTAGVRHYIPKVIWADTGTANTQFLDSMVLIPGSNITFTRSGNSLTMTGASSSQFSETTAVLANSWGGANVAKWYNATRDTILMIANGKDTVWIEFGTGGTRIRVTNGTLSVSADSLGKFDDSTAPILIWSQTMQPNDSGTASLGSDSLPWGLFYCRQLYLLETTGTDSWKPVAMTEPSSGQVLKFDGTSWAPGTDNTGAGGGSGDTLIVNVGGTEYSIVSDRIKAKSGTGIAFTREDSTQFDLWRIAFDSTGVVVSRAKAADSAGKATNDGAGNAITTTYLPRSLFDDSVIATTAKIPTAALSDSAKLIRVNSIDSTNIKQQGIHGLDVDSTSNNFIFDNAYSGTSAVPDSEFATKLYARDAGGDSVATALRLAGGTMNAGADVALNNGRWTAADYLSGDTLALGSEGAIRGFDSSLTSTSDSLHVALIPDGAVSGTAKIASGAVDSVDILDQTVKRAETDTTANNFVFDDAYRGTSASADSALSTEYYVRRKADTLILRIAINNPSLLASNDTIPIAHLDTLMFPENATIIKTGYVAMGTPADTCIIAYSTSATLSSGTVVDSIFMTSTSGEDASPVNSAPTPEDYIFCHWVGSPGFTGTVNIYIVYSRRSKT